MIEGNGVYSAMGTTVFEAVSGLARQLGAINLGQGFPDGNGPPELLDAAARAFRERSSQYPPSAGIPELRAAVAAFYRRRQGLDIAPEQVIVTSGATEALADALLALVRPGDEVWEEVRFDGTPHRSLMTFPGMADRCVKIGSAGKLFGLTGWKIGWMIAAPSLTPLLARAHQFLTFTSAPGLQWAVAEGLGYADTWFAAQNAGWAASRQRLRAGLERAGLHVLPNAATWFLCADLAASGITLGDAGFADRAIREAGVAAIPVSAFCEGAPGPAGLVRFCFTKPDAMLDEACARLERFVAGLA